MSLKPPQATDTQTSSWIIGATLMETTFTPLTSFGGGLAIGLGSVLLMLGLGRIMGATGILSGLALPDSKSEFAWRGALAVGMILSPGLIFALTGTMPEVNVPVSRLNLFVKPPL